MRSRDGRGDEPLRPPAGELPMAALRDLAALLEERLGLRLDREHQALLRAALRERIGSQLAPALLDAYRLRLREEPAELERLLPLVTVGKTSFFRDEGQFRALARLLPELLASARQEGRRLSIWSAGCSTGEELYSLGIALLEAGAEPGEVELLGTDVNAEAIRSARVGRYPMNEALPPGFEWAARHLELDGAELVAGPRLRELVELRVHNLHDRDFPLPRAGAWDLILCRNVLIYFSEDALRGAIDRVHASLRPGGWLFLGYSESLFRVHEGFELHTLGDAFVYRRPLAEDASDLAPSPQATSGAPTLLRRPAPARAPRTATPLTPAPLAPTVATPAARQLLQQAIDRFREGSFASARAILEVGVRAHPRDVGLRLTLAHILALLREIQEANACYEEAIALDDLLAEPHLFHGMHLMEQGELDAALRSLTRAAFLDPSIPLAHFFLGRCHERLGDAAAARRAYRNAMVSTAKGQAAPRFLSYYPDLPDDGDAVARAAALALAGL